MDVDKLDFETSTIWIQLPNLHMRFWSPKAISKLASFVGVPRSMDRLTAKRARLGYARILVELSSKIIPPDFIPITGPDGEEAKQPVIYEHMLPKCTSCGFNGHLTAQCRKPRKTALRPASPQKQQPIEEKVTILPTKAVEPQKQVVAIADDGKNVKVAKQSSTELVAGTSNSVDNIGNGNSAVLNNTNVVTAKVHAINVVGNTGQTHDHNKQQKKQQPKGNFKGGTPNDPPRKGTPYPSNSNG